MPIMNLSEIDDERKGPGLLPLGRYPARLTVETYQRNKDGVLIMGTNDLPLKLTTQDGHEKWALFWTILGPEEHAGRKIFDSLSFTSRGAARAKLLLKAVGACHGNEAKFEAQPEHLNPYLLVHNAAPRKIHCSGRRGTSCESGV